MVPQAVYNFWQYELCDVFIELMKPVMALDDAGAGRLQRGCGCYTFLPYCPAGGRSKLPVGL
jgi:valyl-tRNA synthetase